MMQRTARQTSSLATLLKERQLLAVDVNMTAGKPSILVSGVDIDLDQTG
jgi:hypothetical protein